MNTMISPPPLPKAVPAPAASLQSHHHALNLTSHHNLLLLPPPAKPSSPRRPEEPSRSPLRVLETPSRPIKKEGPRPTRKSSTTDVLRLMDALALPVPPETYLSLVKECTLSGDSDEALELHRHLKRSGHRPSLGLLNRVLLMHVSCGCVRAARQLFDEMFQRDFLSWAVMFAAFMEQGDYEEAMRMFLGIRDRFGPSEVPSWMVSCVLTACVCSMNVELGKQVHGWVLKTGNSKDKPIQSCLMNFYGKFGNGNSAITLFNGLPHPDFEKMDRTGMRNRCRIISRALKASGGINDGGHCGKQIHANAIKVGVKNHGLVQCGLVYMYARHGLLINARRVYDEMATNKRRYAVCSNSLIKGYLRHGYSVEAIKLLYEMTAEGIRCPEALLDKVRVLSGS
ncbi:pentatricopeptide repeat-containing protein At1g31790 [Punica granatum]|uniref:Pentatricopeptide repeat-containing protein At1g31790 n=2 Tax=Punica granatum TaxID=22663 RepID=A0A6P8DII0_PUNGR|nr:pentatricopeptide repeat-containing protein At1g31790 [Punica granatum]PKI57245.1 hypothetical protein CRG98_022342 [Punica granatum]